MVKRGSENGQKFIKACRGRLAAMPVNIDDYASEEDIERWGNWIQYAFDMAWSANVEKVKPSHHAKSWWNAECNKRAKELRNICASVKSIKKDIRRYIMIHRLGISENDDEILTSIENKNDLASIHLIEEAQKIKNASNRLRAAAKRAKRDFFEGVLKHTHPSRIWNNVEWMKPQKQVTNVALTNSQGDIVTDSKGVGEIFQQQFTPTNGRPVDMTIADEMEQLEERAFPPMSRTEMQEALKGTSNFSAPGPDHVSWFW
ncbi:uncharacterized protein PHACADRAFT_91700, partial [Phanerochaete carnosa HHB-10118-sp]